MNINITFILIGVFIGILDCIPMIRMKIDNYSVLSAFTFHAIMPTVVLHSTFFAPWIDSIMLYTLLTLPLAILARKDDPKAPLIMMITSIIVGLCIGLLKAFLM